MEAPSLWHAVRDSPGGGSSRALLELELEVPTGGASEVRRRAVGIKLWSSCVYVQLI